MSYTQFAVFGLFFITFTVCYRITSKVLSINSLDGFKVRMLAHSEHAHSRGRQLITWHLRYPRFIHSEIMTHKDFSRSAASSRAIPVKKMLSNVWNDPAMPIHWGKNRPGMQASTEVNSTVKFISKFLWILASRLMCIIVWILCLFKLHKQTANRLLEPWMYMEVTLTTSKVNNFFALRIHWAAQPEILYLATLMRHSLEESTPTLLYVGDWHLPYISNEDRSKALTYASSHHKNITQLELLKRISAARCARSSYGNSFNVKSIDDELKTYDKLVKDTPVHASPCEHQATIDTFKYTKRGRVWNNPNLHGNLEGFIQYRRTIPNHYID